MLRVLLACMVPCLAIGFTGLLVTTIGRTLLAVSSQAATITALVLTILIMVGCAIASSMVDARQKRVSEPHRH